MSIQIIGNVNKNRLYCAGSFTKHLTTFVCLSLLAEQYDIDAILDDADFFNRLCTQPSSKQFLTVFQKIIGSDFTLHDICSYYTGLPYTFDLSEDEIEKVEMGLPFKHHTIPDEAAFLYRCHNKITPVYKNQCKFHYSELSILFLGYLIEKVFDIKIETLFNDYLIEKFNLKNSYFSRKKVEDVYIEDLSDKYDYPSIAILDHGYFCYSNGFYTTLNDTKRLLENIIETSVFHHMTDLKHARAASGRLLNGLAIEIRLVGDDVLYGYEGLSFSGCNIWAYSTKQKKGVLTVTNDEEAAYNIYHALGYSSFDKVPEYTEIIYQSFIKQYTQIYHPIQKNIPTDYQGSYHRVNINEKILSIIFYVSENCIKIRNPDEIKYDIMFVNNAYRIQNKDMTHGTTVAFYQSDNGNKYMLFDGTLYIKIHE